MNLNKILSKGLFVVALVFLAVSTTGCGFSVSTTSSAPRAAASKQSVQSAPARSVAKTGQPETQTSAAAQPAANTSSSVQKSGIGTTTNADGTTSKGRKAAGTR